MVSQAMGAVTAEAVRDEQIRMLYSHGAPVLFANMAVASLVAFALRSTAAACPIVLWLALVTGVTVARMELLRRYRKAGPIRSDLKSWGLRFVAGSIASGGIWGLAVVCFFREHGLVPQVLLTLTVGGLIGGAAGTLSCYLPAFWGFSIPALVPLVIRSAVLGDSLHVTLAAMAAVFGVALAVVALNTHRAIREAFRLRFENETLLERLSRAQTSLEETNRTLENRIHERSAALERQSETLRRAQQLESVGRLAGGIAHDFNNLLTVILANVTLLLREPQLPDNVRGALEEVEGAADRGAELVRQLLAFGRRQRLAPRILDVNQVVASLESMLVRLMSEKVRIVITPAPQPALVKADRGQLEQVIINLVTNARDAMPDGGTLTIATAIVDAQSAADGTGTAGAQVALSVSDTGTGMDRETQRHVFEPFFTTKEQGKGTGLGLATVYGVVDQSGGQVVVESSPGSGTIFRVTLPLAKAAEMPARPPAVGPVAAAGRATILLAEDNAQVRTAMQRVLTEAGHQVLAAADGEAALVVARAHPGVIDVLITDVVMTGLGGRELAQRLRRERPRLRVLFVSGYNQDDTFTADDPSQRSAYLQKPVTFDILERKLAALLERAALDKEGGGAPGDGTTAA